MALFDLYSFGVDCFIGGKQTCSFTVIAATRLVCMALDWSFVYCRCWQRPKTEIRAAARCHISVSSRLPWMPAVLWWAWSGHPYSV